MFFRAPLKTAMASWVPSLLLLLLLLLLLFKENGKGTEDENKSPWFFSDLDAEIGLLTNSFQLKKNMCNHRVSGDIYTKSRAILA